MEAISLIAHHSYQTRLEKAMLMTGEKGPAIRVAPAHVALLRKMQVIWIPIEAEGPYISHDAPYGSKSIAADVRAILTEHGLGDHTTMDAAEAQRLHEESLKRLPIFISAGRLTPQNYSYVIGLSSDERDMASWGLKHRRPSTADNVDIVITEDHIKLLKHLRIEMDADYDDLALNVKRPYGDMTCIEIDMAAILGVASAGQDLSKGQCAELFEFHESLEGVLQVWLQHAIFEPGDYQLDETGNWQKVIDGDSDRIVILNLARRPPLEALITAIKQKDLAAIRHFLEQSADLDAQDSAGFTPMGYAIATNSLSVVKIFLQAGMDVNCRQGKAQWTPLLQAAAVGSADIFLFLLEQGADLALRTPYQTSALGVAVLYERENIIALIREKGWSEPGSLGVSTYPQDQSPRVYERLGVMSGAVIANVGQKTVADRMKLQIDDVIVKIDEYQIISFKDLISALQQSHIGDVVQLQIIRKGERLDVSCQLGPRLGEAPNKFKVDSPK